MADQSRPNPSLTAISHLFLSSIRDRQTNGAPRPQRTPPMSATSSQAAQASQPPQAEPAAAPAGEDLTNVFSTPEMEALSKGPVRIGPVTALVASHLGSRQREIGRQFAAHLAEAGQQRVGMIEVEASEFRLSCFERGSAHQAGPATAETPQATSYFEPRHLADAVEELNCDVDRWVVLVINPRLPEAQAVMREAWHWTLLSTCDHDGVVAGYRALKGLAEIARPRLALSVVEAADSAEAERTFQKLSHVCQQFLQWNVERSAVVEAQPTIAEHVVMCWSPTKDKAQLASAPQWEVVSAFLARARAQGVEEPPMLSEAEAQVVTSVPAPEPVAAEPEQAARAIEPAPAPAAMPISPPLQATPSPAPVDSTDDVIELPTGEAAEIAVLSSVLKNAGAELVECPVRPPQFAGGRLAVARDRRVVLLAVAKQGLSDLRSIGQAYQWLVQNRGLVAMAVPQMSIDAMQMPQLRLLVDHADLSADVLQAIMHTGTVTVQAYRRVRWGGKMGLLLEAA